MSKHNRTRSWVRLAAIAGFCAILTACVAEKGGGTSIFGPSPGAGRPIYGLERGSQIEPLISGSDREAIANAAGDLLASSQPEAARNWNGGDGDSGQVRLGSTVLLGLDATSGAPVTAPAGIDTSLALAPASGNYTAIKNINVRLGPSATAMVSQTLNAGTTVRAYGYEKTGNWYLIGEPDSVLGYASGDLLKPAGGGEPMLAGGAPKRPRLCRNIDLSITMATSRSDSWTSVVCRTDTGWEVPAERGLN